MNDPGLNNRLQNPGVQARTERAGPRVLAICPGFTAEVQIQTVLWVKEAVKPLMVCHSLEMCAQNANGELIILSLKLFHSIEQAKKDVVPLRYAHTGFTISPTVYKEALETIHRPTCTPGSLVRQERTSNKTPTIQAQETAN